MKQTAIDANGSSSMGTMQTTIKATIEMAGIGVHSGRFTRVIMRPAIADTGILFLRSDIGEDDGYVLAHAANAIETQLCTTIKNKAGTEVRMIEHLMAAFHGLGIDNILVELDGPEVPIYDGSSAMIVEALNKAGIMPLDSHRTYLEILSPVRVQLDNGAWAQLSPAKSLQLDIDIDFSDPGIGKQNLHFDMADEHFADEIALARTFCMFSDVEKMRLAGFGKGGSLDNALVYDEGKILNEGGLRMKDECVKHKALDCIGDLFLVGMPLIGCLSAHLPGHRLSTLLVQALLRDPSAYRIVLREGDISVAPSVEAVDATAVPLAASA
ncbi:MAG: UDP-3-O-acyl-N-acetylglucosamine deacetylase [Candidatus Puniceispirillaceae bacterium]